MKNTIRSTILLVLIALEVAACQPVGSQIGLPTIAPSSVPQSTPVQPVPREAQVQSVEIQMPKTDPTEVNAVVRGNLTEACATLGDTQMSYASNTFMIRLMIVSHPDQNCAQVTTPFEQTIPLKTTGLPDGTYTVKANGVSAVFDLPGKTLPVNSSTSTPEPTRTKTFRSDLYGYEVSYPADWNIQVNHPAGAGKDPEYVTLSTGDTSNLPQIDLWVLTGSAPMSGFENCEKNFVFRSLPACHLSIPAAQNPPAELWIFQNGSANFYIRMIYQDKNSLKLFNDFLASFQFTQ